MESLKCHAQFIDHIIINSSVVCDRVLKCAAGYFVTRISFAFFLNWRWTGKEHISLDDLILEQTKDLRKGLNRFFISF